MRLQKYLTEKTFNIGVDVNFLYNKGFKPFMDSLIENKFEKTKYPIIDRRIKNKKDVSFFTCHSSDLPSREAKEASILNNVTIECGVFATGNFYSPLKKLIQLSINRGAINTVFDRLEYMVPSTQIRNLYQELKPERIKSTIAHEVSHWLNDTLHNSNIKKILDNVRELNNTEIKKLGKADVNMTHFEIDAYIHGIKQLKIENKETWDSLTLADIFFKYVALRTVGEKIYRVNGKDVGDIWQKMLVKRMSRENLLGKNMKKFAKYPGGFSG